MTRCIGDQVDPYVSGPALIIAIPSEIEAANVPHNDDPCDTQAADDAAGEGADHGPPDCANDAVAIVANDGPNDRAEADADEDDYGGHGRLFVIARTGS